MRILLSWAVMVSGVWIGWLAWSQDKPQFAPELTKLMEEVQAIFKPLQAAARYSKAKFETDANHEELHRLSNRLAELMVQTEKYPPAKDLPEKPIKEWRATCQASAQHARELGEAAKKKNYSGYRAAFKRMDAACTRCHEIFR